MDNVTHSLVGLALADGILGGVSRRGRSVTPVFAAILRTSAVVAANAPDFDLAYTIVESSRLGYLIHHRGHTHTMLALPVLWLVGAIAMALAQAVRAWPLQRWHWRVIGMTSALALASHLPLDYGNNYGVHPFWPWENRWYYGDAVFIIEPILWLILGFGVFRRDSGRLMKAALALLAIATIALPWLSHTATFPVACGITVMTAVAMWSCFHWRQSQRLRTCAIACAVFLGGMHAASIEARRAITADLALSEHTWAVEDVVLTPRPGYPTCWSQVAVIKESSGRYRLIGGSFSFLTTADSLRACRTLVDRPGTMPMSPPSLVAVDSRMAWEWEYEGDPLELRTWSGEYCAARAFGQFARAPFWMRTANGFVIGDVRYDRTPQLDFAEIALTKENAEECPKISAPWLSPRSDLFPKP